MGNYFGCINDKEMDKLSDKEQLKLLLSKELFKFRSKPTTLESKIEENRIRIEPTIGLVVDFYNYFLRAYESEISAKYTSFFSDFEDTIYGLEKLEAKKEALVIFNERYNQVNEKSFNFLYNDKQEGLIDKVSKMGRFQKLDGIRNGYKINLTTPDVALKYVYGDNDIFDSEEFIKNDIITATINFEVTLKILVNLNNDYHFEDDYYFSKYGVLLALYKKYDSIFINFELFLFVNNKIETFKDLKSAQIESLYAALLELDLIGGKNVDFANYVNEQHQMNYSKIKKHKYQVNLKHDFRLKKFKDELQKFATKKL